MSCDVRLARSRCSSFVGGMESFSCPSCGGNTRPDDTRRRSWRHLATCQYRTILRAEVPRVRCSKHGVHTIGVPWSDAGSRFTALFAAVVVDWLGASSMSAVARLLDLSWDQVDGVMQRAVKRRLERRGAAPASRLLGVDETSFQKRHEYVTAVADISRRRAERHRARRQLPDPVAQEARPRLSRSGPLPHCHLLPSRRSRRLPRFTLIPLETLTSQSECPRIQRRSACFSYTAWASNNEASMPDESYAASWRVGRVSQMSKTSSCDLPAKAAARALVGQRSRPAPKPLASRPAAAETPRRS